MFDGKDVWISFITELELLCKPGLKASEKKEIQAFIDDCTILEINASIKEITISIRQSVKIKLPDAIIAATSIFWNLPFFTRDEDFKTINGLNCFFVKIHFPYLNYNSLHSGFSSNILVFAFFQK